MEHGLKRSNPLYELLADYESMSECGDLVYLDQKAFQQVIQFYQRESLPDRALEAANHAIGQHPYSSDLLLLAAHIFLLNDKPYKAMSCLDKAEVVSPGALDVVLLRAKVLGELSEFNMALTLLAEVEDQLHSNDEIIGLHLCYASVHDNMRDYSGMFDHLVEVLELDPMNSEALERIWVCVEITKNYDESIALHQELLEHDAYSYQAWYNLGHAHACIGEYRKAIEALEYSFLINADFESGYLDCAELCCQEHRYKKALAIYAEMVDRFGSDSEYLVKIAECQFKMGQIDDTIATLVEALRLDHYNDEVYYYLGKCFITQKRFENATTSLLKAIELHDRREEYFAELASVYASSGELGKADFYFSRATEVGPEQEYYWMQHCRFLLNNNQIEKALEVIEEADYHTFGPELMYCKAICQFKLNQRRKALKSLGEALMENFELHQMIFDISPELKQDDEIAAIVRYYEGEIVNSLG